MSAATAEPGWAVKAAASAFVLLLAAVLLETAARLLPESRNDPSRITRILRHDPDLFWTQKAGLDTVFAGVALRTNSLGFRGNGHEIPKRRFRIVVMGASPALGWGVREELTYAGLLRNRLKPGGKPAEVINASVIGYSSFQGIKLLRSTVLPLAPDLIVITYGVNDPDKYRFFRDSGTSDKDAAPAPLFISLMNRAVQASRAIGLYARLVHRLAGSAAGQEAVFRENRRVSGEDFLENIKSIAAEARKAGAKVVLATNPFMLPAGSKRPGRAARAEADALAARAGKPDGGRGLLDRALKLDPGSPRALFLLASRSAGKDREALLKRARISEMEDCMLVLQRYNGAIRAWAGTAGLPLCDLETLFSPGGKPVPGYFLDPERDMVHFSAAGHQAAAEAFTRALRP